MAERFALGIAQKGLEQLSSLAFQEIGLVQSAESELHELKLTITTIKTLLLDAEKRQLKRDKDMLWLERFKQVCYAVDDIVDEFEIVALKQQQVLVVVSSSSSMQRRWSIFKSKVRHFLSCSNPLVFPFRIGHQIKNVRERVARIANEKALSHQQSEDVDGDLWQSHPPVSDLIIIDENSDDIVRNFLMGSRGEDREIIMMKFLMDSRGPECFSSISTVGIACIGKTTLAKIVYNDPRVSQHFQLRIWASVDNDFILKTLLVRILELVTHKSCTRFHTEQQQNSIKENFKDKRFLFILDNLNHNDRGKWVDLSSLFKGGAKGSKIIVTTRNRSVASIVSPVPSCNLKGLSHETSLSLFESWVFAEERRHGDLMRIGEEIVKKCEGVPLAIKRLAIVLYRRKDKQFWLEVQRDKSWTFNRRGCILQSLTESYEQLNSVSLETVFCLLFHIPKGLCCFGC